MSPSDRGRMKAAMAMTMFMAMAADTKQDFGIDLSLPEKPEKSARPWARLDIPKSIRKGKTFEEIDAMKKAIWDAAIEGEKAASEVKVEIIDDDKEGKDETL